MKLLFDENLSRKLVPRLRELYSGSAHIADYGLLQKSDLDIWEFARREHFIVVRPAPISWTCPTRDAEHLLRREAVRITEFAADPELSVLVLNRD